MIDCGTRLLLVEDDDDHAALISRAIRKRVRVDGLDHVTDGEQLQKFLRGDPPHENAKRPAAILLDLNMPRMDGQEVLEWLRGEPEYRMIPVVVLTTSKSEADRARAYASGANSYVVKPLEYSSFQELVGNLAEYWTACNEPPPLQEGVLS